MKVKCQNSCLFLQFLKIHLLGLPSHLLFRYLPWITSIFWVSAWFYRPGLVAEPIPDEVSSAGVVAESVARASRTFGDIEIDGHLNEPGWQDATPIGKFVQIEPAAGQPMTQPTEVRILFDDSKIYFGLTCIDSEMSLLVANKMRRDSQLYDNDNVFILLDTYNDGRSGFFFRVNPLGAIEDVAIMDSGDSRNENWDAVWECCTSVNPNDWTAEIAIPFSQLRFDKKGEMTWGLNVGRSIRRLNEEGSWAPVPATYGWEARYRTAHLGRLTGLDSIASILAKQRNLEFLPYFLSGLSRASGNSDTVFDIGMDLKFGLASNLTSDLTINTDFAQVEADQEEVNLTRFSLFFPEKRPFFLEGAGLFDFGIPRTSYRRPPPLLLFYSRRIGLVGSSAIPVLGGGKVTGKVGPYGVGLLNVLTDKLQTPEDGRVGRTNYSVLRLKRDILTGSSVGLIAINKQDSDAYHRAGGLDFIFNSSDVFTLRGLWARTFNQEFQDRNNAWYLGGRWRKENYRLVGSYIDIGQQFSPEVGYVRRQGVRQIRLETRYTPFLNKFGLRRIWAGPELDLILKPDIEDQLETLDVALVNWFELESGGWFNFQVHRTQEQLVEDFEIRPEVLIPVGKYRFNSMRFSISTDDSKVISGRFGANFGQFYDGTRRGFSLRTDFRPNSRFSLEPRYEFNRIRLPLDTFNANLIGVRSTYAFSTNLFVKLFTQWVNEDNMLSANLLLNYIYQPGSDFYIVINQNYDTGDGQDKRTDTTVLAKMTYWWNP